MTFGPRTVAAGAGLILLAVIVLAASAVLSRGASAGDAPHYLDEATEAGVAHAYTGDFAYLVGGGVAAFDCNADNLIDLYFAGGSSPAALFVNNSPVGGALSFSRQPDPLTDVTGVTGAYPLDVDGDGITDLAVIRNGENLLLRGEGDCRFARANEDWSFQSPDEWSTAFSAKWDRGASWPTLAVGNYLADDSGNSVARCLDNDLYTPGLKGFAPPAALAPAWCPLSMLFTDWDRSGRRDLRLSNDRHYYGDYSDGEEQLWRVAPGESPRLYTREDGWQRVRVFGMGIGEYDVTGDGYPDYYLTSQADNKLQTLADGPAQPNYVDIGLSRGTNATTPYVGDTTLPSTAWHSEFQDVNNDGFIDLFVAKGNVEVQLDFAMQDPSNLMLGSADGGFREAGTEAGIDSFARGRGGALVDLNNDGLLELVIVDRVTNVRVYRNLGSGRVASPQRMGHWIGIDLRQDDANRDAIGAWLEVRVGDVTAQRERTIGGGHVSGELAPMHFGLGGETSAQVRVTWPDGSVGDWQTLDADHAYLIDRASATPQLVY